jgi:ubiquinol oxidase
MAGSILLRHAGTRLFAAAAVSPAAAARPALLAGADGVPAVMVRLMSTSSSSPTAAAAATPQKAKEEAAKDGGDKKAVVINSYWGIEQTNKLMREDGTEWRWTCFRVRDPRSGSLRLLFGLLASCDSSGR